MPYGLLDQGMIQRFFHSLFYPKPDWNSSIRSNFGHGDASETIQQLIMGGSEEKRFFRDDFYQDNFLAGGGKTPYSVTPAKAGVQNALKRFRLPKE